MTTRVIVFARIEEGDVRSLRVVGEQCPVDGNGAEVNWIGSVDQLASLDWLEGVALGSRNDSTGSSALHALALHANPEAGRRLYALATAPSEDLAREAVFWLGESRGEEGFDLLKLLLAELPAGDVRREINFALGQNGSDPATDLLVSIAHDDNDPGQRSGAMFWLAEQRPAVAEPVLLEVLSRETDEDVLQEAVFAISRLPGDKSTNLLLSLARDKEKPKKVRRQALFWLAHSDDEKAVAALTDLLSR